MVVPNQVEKNATTIQYQSLSAPTKHKNNPKNHLKQNTNTQYTPHKSKNTSNPPHTPKKPYKIKNDTIF